MTRATLDIVLDEPIGTISPLLYGHFMEHLGGCIEGGLWVGPGSKTPNIDGIRNDVVRALRKIRPPVIRWPGGCFADDYDWRDGIGPAPSRPRRVNMHWGDVIESNGFGTHEFIALCRMLDAEPYFAGNLGSGSPREMRNWVEYCNFPGGSTLSDERIANGALKPFGVRYWGVGNENWGCGGNFSPEDYATEYRRYATYLRTWGGTKPYLIACGPNGNDVEWTRRFFTKLTRDYGDTAPIHGFAAHHYSWSQGVATEFDEPQWFALLHEAAKMEPLLVTQRALMDTFDPARKIGLIVDEWGTWHKPTPGQNPAFLWQQNTVRDALVAALTLDIFNRNCEKVEMANIAQTINVLQSLILTDEDRMAVTPTYHVFDLYQAHQGGEAQRLVIGSPSVAQGLPHLSGSASRKGSTLTLTLTNASMTEPVEAELRFLGGVIKEITAVRGLAYESGKVRACNTPDEPDAVQLGDMPVAQANILMVPPATVMGLTLEL